MNETQKYNHYYTNKDGDVIPLLGTQLIDEGLDYFFLETRACGPQRNTRNLLKVPTNKAVHLHVDINPLHPFNRERLLSLFQGKELLHDTSYIGGLTNPKSQTAELYLDCDMGVNKYIKISLFHDRPKDNYFTYHFNGAEQYLTIYESLDTISDLYYGFGKLI